MLLSVSLTSVFTESEHAAPPTPPPPGSRSWAADPMVVFVLLEKKSLFLANVQLFRDSKSHFVGKNLMSHSLV